MKRVQGPELEVGPLERLYPAMGLFAMATNLKKFTLFILTCRIEQNQKVNVPFNV